tara:strand:- start:1503 stop:2627 length:1125 start_codon:yes stop_codon:yes gene_type:complete
MKSIHWLGAGLSSIPGIRRLAKKNVELTVWNRTLSKAEKSINHVNSENIKAKEFNFSEIKNTIDEGDIVISQLAANMHPEIAKLCLQKKCHFASTSYISPEIIKLNKDAKELNLVFINEVGLDPGIDHFFSHLLVNELKNKKFKNLSVSYKSYCGGIPALPNDFKYKFSWSPLGVIKALNNNSIFIENFKETVVVPYKHIRDYSINNEIFEAYPNRNSIPYIKEYMFAEDWKIEEFVRGTLRLKGWKNAWKEIFDTLENKPDDLDEKIKNKSDELWNLYKYKENEEDRVILWVKLDAKKDDKNIWSKSYYLDEKGSGEDTAMAKLVSITLSASIDLIIENKLPAGVQAASSNKNHIDYFFKILSDYSIKINSSE